MRNNKRDWGRRIHIGGHALSIVLVGLCVAGATLQKTGGASGDKLVAIVSDLALQQALKGEDSQ
jgi:hypothetical protein